MHDARRIQARWCLGLLDGLGLAVLWWVAPSLREVLVGAWPFDLVPTAAVFRPLDVEGARSILPVVVAAWLVVLHRPGDPDWDLPRPKHLVGSAAVGLAVLISTLYLLRVPHVSRTLLVGFALASVPLLAFTRLLLPVLLAGRERRVVVVVGDVEHRRDAGPVDVVARLVPDPEGAFLEALGLTLEQHAVDEVWLAEVSHAGLDGVARLCAELGVSLTVDVDVWGVRPTLIEGDGRHISLRFAPARALDLAAKRVLDVVLGSLLLVLLAPVMLVLVAVVKAGDGGPALFVQERAGLHGRVFPMWKFRTMVPGAESGLHALRSRNEMSDPVFKLADDPRITSVGRVLRRWSLDELPQLVHVVRGQMSLVGPRPPIPSEVAGYARWQRRRLSMRPGLTCLWQVSGRSDLDFDTWMRLDLRYIDSWSLGLDLALLIRTVPAVLRGTGAR